MQPNLGDVVILSLSDDQEPTFGIVNMMLIDNDQHVLLCTTVCTNVIYETHLRVWEIKPLLSLVRVVKLNTEMTQQILQPIPANLYSYYISLKYTL